MTRILNILNGATTVMLDTTLGESTRPQIIDDSLKLFNDGTTWLIAFSIGLAVFIGIASIIVWYNANENEKPAAVKRIKGVVIGSICVVAFESIFKFILSYYTH